MLYFYTNNICPQFKISDRGKCTQTSQTCKARNYCPSSRTTETDCMPCSQNFQYGKGCYCEDNTPIRNCKECSGTSCSKCIPFTFLSNGECEDCDDNCKICTGAKTCTECIDNFFR